MSNPNFIDYIKIFCKSGNGGSGSSHFRREKFVPKGGPDGGDGGKGGNIILKGNSQLWTLLHLRYTKHLTAENGGDGSGSKKHGKDGKNIIIEVPLGTIAKSDENDEKILEILNDNEEKVLLEGGIGGLGNFHFKSATNQSPHYSQSGEKGSEIISGTIGGAATTGAGISLGAAAGTVTNNSITGATSGIGIIKTLGTGALKLEIEALQSQGKTKILSNMELQNSFKIIMMMNYMPLLMDHNLLKILLKIKI